MDTVPVVWSMLASSSRWALRLVRLAGSPVLCRTMVSSWTLFANDSGDCNYTNQRAKVVCSDVVICFHNERRRKKMFLLKCNLWKKSPAVPLEYESNEWDLVNDGLHVRLVDQVPVQQRRPLLGRDAEAGFHGDVHNLGVVFSPESFVRAEFLLQLHQWGVFISLGYLDDDEGRSLIISFYIVICFIFKLHTLWAVI